MKKNHITRTIIASAVLFSFNAAAATSYFEARNDAMGGTGVASSHYGVAPLANPALLTKHNSNDDFSLLLPSVGAQVADPDDVSNKADDVKDDWDLFDSAVTVFCKNGDITNPELSGGKMPDAGRNMTWDLRAPAPTPSHLRATVAIKGSFRGAEF